MINIDPSKWRSYLKNKQPYSSMHTALKLIKNNDRIQAIFLAAYEESGKV